MRLRVVFGIFVASVLSLLLVLGAGALGVHAQTAPAPDLTRCTNGFATIFGLPTRLSRGIGTPHEAHGIRLYVCDRGQRIDYRFNPRDLTLVRTEEFRCNGGRCP